MPCAALLHLHELRADVAILAADATGGNVACRNSLWTVETFGPRQAAAYEEDLIARCREIADGVAITQGCRQLIDPNLPEDLRFTRSGQHFIVFIEDAAQVIIVDFLHARSDLPGKIAALSSAKTQNNH